MKTTHLAYLLLSATLAACGASHAESTVSAPQKAGAKAAKTTTEAIPVMLTRVVQLPADAPLRATGRVSHARDMKPAFKTGGLIKEILVDEGDRVTPGQVLARLDTREIDAGLAQARAGLAKADRDLARVDGLVSANVLPGTTRDDAKTAATVARAQLAGLSFNRETATLTATTAGVVVKRLAEPHEVIGPGVPVLVIGESTADRIEIEVGVPARDVGRVKVGDHARVRLDGDVADKDATVTELAPTLTPGTDRLTVTLSVAGTAPRGMVGVATFAPRAAVTLAAVPLTTLVEGLGREATVWVPVASGDAKTVDHVAKKTVTIARITSDGMALVSAGLEGVSEVIDAGNAWLDADATIVVKAPAGATTSAASDKE